MITPETIAENRAKVVKALRETTERQGKGSLYDPGLDCYCAVGVIARELGHDPKCHRYPDGGDMGESYDFVEEALGLTRDGAREIWRRNDNRRMSFRQIGDWLATEWGIA